MIGLLFALLQLLFSQTNIEPTGLLATGWASDWAFVRGHDEGRDGSLGYEDN